jgi:hypothetical protein
MRGEPFIVASLCHPERKPKQTVQKAKGRPPLREFAPSSDSSKIWLGFQITTPFAISVVKELQAEAHTFSTLRHRDAV